MPACCLTDGELQNACVLCCRTADRVFTIYTRPNPLPRLLTSLALTLACLPVSLAVNEDRRSAVHFFAARGNAEVVQRLLKAGGEVGLADKEGGYRC
jgi:hypothetical protein